MKCPKCGSTLKVISVNREKDENVMVRYRRCVNEQCRHKVVTNQVLVLPEQFQEKIVPTQTSWRKKLTLDEVYQVRALYECYLDGAEFGVTDIAAKFGISDSTCSKIARRITYKDYE